MSSPQPQVQRSCFSIAWIAARLSRPVTRSSERPARCGSRSLPAGPAPGRVAWADGRARGRAGRNRMPASGPPDPPPPPPHPPPPPLRGPPPRPPLRRRPPPPRPHHERPPRPPPHPAVPHPPHQRVDGEAEHRLLGSVHDPAEHAVQVLPQHAH